MPSNPVRIGPYKILERLGAGTMGAVYLGLDPRLGRRVALKLLLADYSASDKRRTWFAREARAAASLNHVNVVTIFDVGEHEGQPFIAMEYVAGQTLRELIRARAPLSLARKLEIVGEVCNGISAAHHVGLVHRDLKPSNIMVGDNGLVKVLDFGVARIADVDTSQDHEVVGTINYMSPEQLRGEIADARADVFAVAAILYEVLAYRQAFPGDLAARLAGMSGGPLAPLADIVPDIDPSLDRIVAKGLNQDPVRRYQTLEEFSEDLRRCAERLQRRRLFSIVADMRSWVSARFAVLFPSRPAAANRRPREEPLASSGGVRVSDATIAPSDSSDRLPADQGGANVRDATVFLLSPSPGAHADASRNAQLVLAGSGRVFTITATRMEIGRAGCDITIADDSVSRRHAVIESSRSGFSISDLGSSYGTVVNGRLITEATPLFFGAVIKIGSVMMVFSSGSDESVADLTDCTIVDRYTLTRKLRESARGAVYAATDRNVRSEVAIKLLSPHLARLPGYREQFDREIEIAGQLFHPNICRVRDSGPARIQMKDGTIVASIFLTYPLMTGGNLADRLAGNDAVPVERAVQWISTLAAALSHSHRRDIVHGDLKPTAIVFDEDENIYLSDFAFGHRALNADRRRSVGSPAYVSPEQWNEGIATTASDQFALAVIAYYMLTGSRPFEGQDNPEVRAKNFRRGPIPAHQEARQHRRGDFDRGVSDVLARALAVSPADRFPSIDEFAKGLGKAVRGIVDSAQIFLSYQRGTSAGWANNIAEKLKHKHRMNVFLDVTKFDAGPFPDRIAEAIRHCKVFVCLLGGTTLDSKWVRLEINLAHQFNKPMIPIRQEGFDDSLTHGDEAVRMLVESQGVRLLDEYAEEAIARIATLIESALKEDGD